MPLAACSQLQVPTSLASLQVLAPGCFCYSVYIALNIFSSVPVLPVGRTGSSIVALSLMVVTLVISPDMIYAAIGCNMPLLFIVISTMILSELLVAKAFAASFMIWVATSGHNSPHAALAILMALTSCFTAFLGWDTASIAMAGPVLNLCKKKRW